jgi:uncharacterized repeat protein (TIGR03803 family)
MKCHPPLLRYTFLLAAVLSMFFVVTGKASAASESTLYSFNPLQSGSLPDGGVVADAAGNLYGVTANGGTFGYGTVFEFSPNQQGGWKQETLYHFRNGNDGGDPEGGVIFDAEGNLYGMTTVGGSAGAGVVFELMHNADGSWIEKVLSNIDANYARFVFGLVFDSAGNLYGTIGSGGQFSGGVVFELSPTTGGKWKETILLNFHGTSDDAGGSSPVGRLILDQAGNLYGTTSYGGVGCPNIGCGVVYELSPIAGGQWKETVLYRFQGGSDGLYPGGGLIFDEAGNLYGTASGGGLSQPYCECGTVFELSPNGHSGWTESTIYTFQGGNDGSHPEFSLIFDREGNVYGATTDGGGAPSCGTTGCGTVFELTPNGSGGWNESVLATFDPTTTGWALSSGVFLNADGQLFGEGWEGATSAEAGFLYSLTPASGKWNYAAVSNFTYSDGYAPLTAPVVDSKGNLFGTTEYGGMWNFGSVFELKPAANGGWSETIIYSFPKGLPVTDPFFPTAQPSSLILDAAGNLYGETIAGGLKNDGTVYKLSFMPNGTWQATTLHSFPGGIGGTAPSGGLVMDSAGNLYGTTQYGGKGTLQGQRPSGYGIVFELSPGQNGSWSEKTLYQFGGYPTDGAQSLGNLIFDRAGNLYGTTSAGGSSGCTTEYGAVIGCGVAFELTPTNGEWTETILHSFLGGTSDGQTPLAGLVLDRSGNLFGTTSQGGSGFNENYPSGTAFELSPQAGGEWKENLLVQFSTSTGQSQPEGNFLIDASANLYSTTEGYGGSVFELSPTSNGGWNYDTLYAFPFATGYPMSGVIFGPSGHLYGTASYGGEPQNYGYIYAITPQ